MCETFHLVCRVIVRRHSLIGPVASTDVKWRAALLRTEPFAHWAIHSDELPLLSSPTVDPSVVKWNTCGQLYAFLLLLLLCLSHFNSHFTKKKKKIHWGNFLQPCGLLPAVCVGRERTDSCEIWLICETLSPSCVSLGRTAAGFYTFSVLRLLVGFQVSKRKPSMPCLCGIVPEAVRVCAHTGVVFYWFKYPQDEDFIYIFLNKALITNKHMI